MPSEIEAKFSLEKEKSNYLDVAYFLMKDRKIHWRMQRGR